MSAPLLDELTYLVQRLPAAEPALAALARPMARLSASSTPAGGATTSYVGGHPYLPEGEEWPHDRAGRARVFVVQVNFAEVPVLPGFPTSGLLQWFVTDEEGYGVVPEDVTDLPERDRDGMAVRWWPADALDRPCLPPSTARPPHVVDAVVAPAPVGLRFSAGTSMPAFDEAAERADLAAYGPAGADEEWLDEVWSPEEVVDGPGAAVDEEPPWIGSGSKVGGYPHVVQVAPVDSFATDDPAARLILQLDSDVDRWTEWGDVGTAQLFGDPAALSRGDTSSLWWTWAC